MARSALGKTFSLLLLASIITQGLQDVEVFHSETTTAVEGQNVTLPCAIKSQSDLKIVDVEWNKKNENGDKTKLVLYHPLYGLNQFQPNVTIQIENNTANKSTGFSLHLTAVKKWQSGIYICSFSTFPLGSIMREMGLQISELPQSKVTEEGLIGSADGSLTTSPTPGLSTSLTTSPTPGLSTTDIIITGTTSMGTDVTDDNPNPSNVTVTAGEFITLLTNNYTSVTSSPITHTDPYHLLNSTTLSYDSTVFRSTQEMASDETKTESTLHSVNPEDTVSTSTLGNLTENYESPTTRLNTENGIVDEDAARTHLLLLIMVPMFILIIVAGLLYRRHLIKERMDLPPPFKPPPPPVKYTTVRCHETPVKQFAISRCNSESESHILMNSP